MWWLILVALLWISPVAQAETVRIVSWNMEWFPGKKPTSSAVDRIVHMSEAKEALLDLAPDIFCAQEVRDWDSFKELTTIVPELKPLVVSRFQQFGLTGPITIQQCAIASTHFADSAWSESFKPSTPSPPRGFSFASIRVGKSTLLVYSVHLKSNLGNSEDNMAKREAAAHQILSHVKDMESKYGPLGSVVTVIGGDFNVDPTDPRFAGEKTAAILREGFRWAWDGVPLQERITLPAKGGYPDACFDGFFVRGGKILSCKVDLASGGGDHRPVILSLEVE